jgi:hypothetical protein
MHPLMISFMTMKVCARGTFYICQRDDCSVLPYFAPSSPQKFELQQSKRFWEERGTNLSPASASSNLSCQSLDSYLQDEHVSKILRIPSFAIPGERSERGCERDERETGTSSSRSIGRESRERVGASRKVSV